MRQPERAKLSPYLVTPILLLPGASNEHHQTLRLLPTLPLSPLNVSSGSVLQIRRISFSPLYRPNTKAKLKRFLNPLKLSMLRAVLTNRGKK